MPLLPKDDAAGAADDDDDAEERLDTNAGPPLDALLPLLPGPYRLSTLPDAAAPTGAPDVLVGMRCALAGAFLFAFWTAEKDPLYRSSSFIGVDPLDVSGGSFSAKFPEPK